MATKTNTAFRVGDWGKLNYGVSFGLVEVIEDRGTFGRQGRRIYQVQAVESGEPVTFEVAEDDLQAFDYDEAVRYLKNGGLISILSQGSRGRHRPRVWWALDSQGRLKHSYSPEVGMLGGVVIPSAEALHEGKVFLPYATEVREFLVDLGLNQQQADDVIEAVGTAPSSP